MTWKIKYTKEAQIDFDALDNSQKKQVAKAIIKVSQNPLSSDEGGYGKPLRSNLSGFLKIKLLKLGIRVVYGLIRKETTMEIIIISMRDDEKVYRMAQKRLEN